RTLGIVGESGCGKSMTALAIMRLVPTPPGRIASGTIRLQGENLLTVSERQMQKMRGNEISMIFQEPMTSLNPVFTIGDQIAEAVMLHERRGKKDAWNWAVEMLDAVGIPAAQQRANEYPHQMSGGMRQRVMIAMALACRPSVLIADEPTTALDVTVQAQIFDLLLELQEQTNTAIILITHDMGVIAEMAQRVVVMYAGRKVEDAPVDEMLTNPKHPYTRGLIACVPHLQAVPSAERPPLTEVPGVVPSIVELGRGGCPFAPRCAQAMARCREQMPPPTAVVEGHQAACWLLEEATEA
ncbi:MAG: ABC transporter ATP-binding protein, partial [Alphaproteobacteria bacterium]|nr:ABC transporter ATP-binding protein [Alphaproteobacteria bacterium]